jgi:hypothetical protein
MPILRLTLLGLGVAFATGACNDARGNDRLRRRVVAPDTGRPQAPERRIAGAYFGQTKRDSVIEAFVIRLSDDAREAAIYEASALVPLCRQSTTDSAWLSWNASLSRPPRSYTIRVRATDQTLSGWAVTPATALKPFRDSVELRLGRVNIDAALDRTAQRVQLGVYSSLGLHAETGDAIGTELILADGGNGLVGAITFGEGSTSMPYALQHVRAEGDTLRFDIGTEFGPREYVGVKGGEALELALRGSRRNKEQVGSQNQPRRVLQAARKRQMLKVRSA